MQMKQAALKMFCTLPVRGRHRLVAQFGGGGVEPLQVGDVTLPLDLSVAPCRDAYYGVYEIGFVAHLHKALRAGDAFIDPGANFGYIAAVAAKLVGPTGKVIALEPSRTCFGKLSAYLRVPNIELLHAAVHRQSGKAKFYDTPRVVSRGFACLAEVEEPEDGEGYEVDTLSVDDICNARRIERVRYLKLDVEGAELLALQGAACLLQDRRIDFILVETDFRLEITQEIAQLLTHHGYKPFKPSTMGLLKAISLESRPDRFDVIWASPLVAA
jgi:FkbM family methyltransferase